MILRVGNGQLRREMDNTHEFDRNTPKKKNQDTPIVSVIGRDSTSILLDHVAYFCGQLTVLVMMEGRRDKTIA